MDPTLFFYLSSSDDEGNEKLIRRQLRDRSNPLALSNTAFLKRFRLSKEAFDYVLAELNLRHTDAKAVPPVLQLAVTLSILATGGYQHSIGSDYLIGMCQSTVSKITTTVLKEMEKKLCPNHVQFEPIESSECKEWFYKKYKMPGVIGCVAGTHIGLQRPINDDQTFYNSKGYHSLNAMVICDHKCRILAINCSYGGAAQNSFVWKHSEQRAILNSLFQSNRNANNLLLADCSYPLEPWCIRPYRNAVEGSTEAFFNDVHSRARCTMKRTIGILKGRWRILRYDRRGRYNPVKVARFAKSCAALHNICIKYKIDYDPPNLKNELVDTDTSVIEDHHLSRIGSTIRDQIKDSLSISI